jgi:hypothetical protein
MQRNGRNKRRAILTDSLAGALAANQIPEARAAAAEFIWQRQPPQHKLAGMLCEAWMLEQLLNLPSKLG